MKDTIQWLFAENRKVKRPLNRRTANRVREIKNRMQFELRRIEAELKEHGYDVTN